MNIKNRINIKNLMTIKNWMTIKKKASRSIATLEASLD